MESLLASAAGATVTTTAATAICGAVELGNAAAPINAISHIAWGDEAAEQDDLSTKYTVVGGVLNAAAMASWAAVHHFVFRPERREPGVVPALARGAATAAIAYVVDYYVVPKRLTPGFEKRLSGRSLFWIYVALAAGLAVGERKTVSGLGATRTG